MLSSKDTGNVIQNKKYSVHVMKYLSFSYISNDLIANGHLDIPDIADLFY